MEPIGQLGVVESEQVQNGGVQIVDVNFVFGRVKTKVIRLAMDNAWLDAAAANQTV